MLNKRRSCCCEQAFLRYITRNIVLFFNWLTFTTLPNAWSSLSSTPHIYKPERVTSGTWEKSKGNSVLQILNKVCVLRNCAKFPANTCPVAFFLMPQPATLLKKKLRYRYLPVVTIHTSKFSRSFGAQRSWPLIIKTCERKDMMRDKPVVLGFK